ncbi:MAG TPA: hypothetical protein VGW35_20930 [Methylomirabilota bacterium]|nr:hypothetical protein [Methylomirabilota bacterium]
MADTGILEGIARADLDRLFEEITRHYRPGALETLSAAEPEWRAAVDRTEREVGSLYEALCDADATLARWQETVGDLRRLWTRLGEVPAASVDEAA